MATEEPLVEDGPAPSEFEGVVAAPNSGKRTWQDSLAAVDPDHHVHQRQRTESPASSVVTRPTTSLSRRSQQQQQPRWHNQSYMVFLALRQHEDRCLPRTQLIKAALELDKKISEERKLPKVFRGKTPMNSASAILTNNSDRYFIPFKPPGSRSTHFKLAYEPGNFQRAVQEYRKWETMLAEHDWPFCFGELKPGVKPPSPPSSLPQPSEPGNEQTSAKNAGPSMSTDLEAPLDCVAPANGIHESSIINDTMSSNHTVEPTKQDEVDGVDVDMDTVKDDIQQDDQAMSEADKDNKVHYVEMMTGTVDDAPAVVEAKATLESDPVEKNTMTNGATEKEETKMEPTRLEKPGETTEWAPTLDQLDLSNVPKSWSDIVRVDDSKIPGAGKGLFAARRLPHNIPLGFYFGVPMTEDEYDHLKDHVGRASEYSIMYRKTVLDATDDHGQPYSDPEGELFCPFHFMNETDEKGANISFIEGSVVNQVICWTQREIEEGEELLVWYGRDVDRHWKQAAA